MDAAIKNMTESACGHPVRDRTKDISITGLVGISLALLTFLLRMLAKLINHKFGVDDWALVVAMVAHTVLHLTV